MDTVVPDSLSPWKAVPPYIAQRIDGAPIIDGRLDESYWPGVACTKSAKRGERVALRQHDSSSRPSMISAPSVRRAIYGGTGFHGDSRSGPMVSIISTKLTSDHGII